MHGCSTEGADKHFGKVMLTCAINMATEKFEAATSLEKVHEISERLSKMGSAGNLPVVLRPFLTLIQCEIVQNPQCLIIVKVAINPKWA